MNYGNVYRKLRIGKNKTLEDIVMSTGHKISKSFLSKFERGESDISFTRLALILNAINVSLNEFSLYQDTLPASDDIDSYIKDVSAYYYQRDLEKLKTIMDDNAKQYTFTKIFDYRYKELLAKTFYCDLKGEPLPVKDSLDLSDYLFSIDYWGKYELILFVNCIPIMHHETAIALTDELIQKEHIFGDLKSDLQLKINILFNTITNCINNKRLEKMSQYIREVEKYNFNDQLLNEKVLLKFFKIISTTNKENILHSKKEIEKILEFLNFVDASFTQETITDIANLFFSTL